MFLFPGLIQLDWVKYAVIGIACLFFVGLLAYCKHLRAVNGELKEKLFVAEQNLKTCKETNEALSKEIVLQQEKYQKKVADLLKKAQRPVKVIEIPKVIDRPVYVTDEECKKMGIMIDEYLKEVEGWSK